ncbi:MAG: hypothetical protein K8T91_17095 [Planctomycetes bacterium]|nr:hypothetical protein [Planctomycetota bacterium]
MTGKQKILAAVQTMPEDASIDEVIDRLWLLRKIEIAQGQADRGEGIEHDKFMQELLGDDE